MLMHFVSQGDERLCTTKFNMMSSFFLRCLFIQPLLLHTLSSTSFLCILTCCYYFLLTKDDQLLPHTYTYFRTTRIFIYNTRRCRQCILFCIVVVLSLSVYVDSYLFLSYKREKYNAWINFFTPCMHLCMFFFLRLRTFFFTYYQFSFSLVRFVTDK